MKFCEAHLRTNHHMKHSGRMQYGLFLKVKSEYIQGDWYEAGRQFDLLANKHGS